jgi:hypothetical protein
MLVGTLVPVMIAAMLALRWFVHVWALARWQVWISEVDAWKGRWHTWLGGGIPVAHAATFAPHAYQPAMWLQPGGPTRVASSVFPRTSEPVAVRVVRVVRGVFSKSFAALQSLPATSEVDVVLMASDADASLCEDTLRSCWQATSGLPRLGSLTRASDTGWGSNLGLHVDGAHRRPCWLVAVKTVGQDEGGAAILLASENESPALALSRPMTGSHTAWPDALGAFADAMWDTAMDMRLWLTGWHTSATEAAEKCGSLCNTGEIQAVDLDATLGPAGPLAGWVALAYACGVARERRERQVVAWMNEGDRIEWLVVAAKERKNV